ncbi:Fis family transcriptional regulator [Sphingomonas koreensis]|uniref:Fis family transcriptional regulator n=1 Tax=Sphingomonas koreensis TaxID=93064 RepID=A0A1L6J5V6_9SPHN|nr:MULTISPECIES: Fis family transcriptional regulator [Alphaproteobacteria]APR51341.1 Fis family transcriptional regulator [Sphingomonas koreensis]RSU21647.1 Fis family transcriptional regulator [Sphingomonas koreensis]RSU27797.1 Fis family transcriptional regulator [Sphingomonas koreensis]RSU29070.1 Fis family transcriptional regulator [Sphingomonas koreensis]RSU29371.1 Fis family transcriptional regulator [Sphingomonas koreensis]
MTKAADWLSAFPLQPATEAVEALRQGWSELAARPLPDFNPKTKEAALTKRLKVYVENHVARERGLLGMWAAEDIIGDIDPATGAMIEERRTDIVYGWNNETQAMQLVFEFKRLGRQKKHRDHYLRDQGLGRFVTGIYSRKQAVAAMVGVLLDPEPEIVPHIRAALGDAALATLLRLKPTAAGEPYARPSSLFTAADFDTEHEREPALAPSHGSIRVSHFFFSFGYPTTTVKPKS